MNRGYWREPIFHDDIDRKRFVTTLSEACAKTDWQVHAYCLMNNHFHLVFETPEANLVAGMRWFFEHLHGAVQPSAQAVWAFVQRTLQVADCGWQRHGRLADGVRRCAFESRAREVIACGTKAARFCMEQLAGLSPSRRSNVRAGCGWTGCWANCTFPRTALPGGRNWRIIWK